MEKSLLSGRLAFGLLFALWLFSGCGSRDDFPDGTEFQTSVDYSFASSEFSAIRSLVDLEAMKDTAIWKTGSFKINGIYCPTATATVTITGSNTATLEIDFGNGTNCIDGRVRSGTLQCQFNGKWSQEGSQVTITPTNYTVNSFPVLFTQTITNNGTNNDGNPNWDVVVTGASIVTTTGTISWTSDRNTEWTAGDDTPTDATDNEYMVTGSANGTTRTQLNFTATITEPLHVKSNCGNIVSGIIEIKPDTLQLRSLDYGEGVCDNIATLSIGAWSAPLNLF